MSKTRRASEAMFNPAFEPEGFRPPERAAFLFFRCAKRGDGIFGSIPKVVE